MLGDKGKDAHGSASPHEVQSTRHVHPTEVPSAFAERPWKDKTAMDKLSNFLFIYLYINKVSII